LHNSPVRVLADFIVDGRSLEKRVSLPLNQPEIVPFGQDEYCFIVTNIVTNYYE
jgi:hypothetical protein